MPITSAPRKSAGSTVDHCKLLVERLASSAYLNKSARLHGMFLYLCERVLDHSAEVIHEQEVGHRVFGRSPDYDTNADNIVRVHASMLRKRIEQYFANEGREEPVVIDIPRGNYAPVFRKREVLPLGKSVPQIATPAPSATVLRGRDPKLRFFIALSLFLVCLVLGLLWRIRGMEQGDRAALPNDPIVRQFWSGVFTSDKPTDVVLDDAALGYFQELTGHQVRLSEYFDRSYVRSIENSEAGTLLGRAGWEALILKRQSSYANSSLLWKLAQMAAVLHNTPKLHFARDFSFRELKADNAILLGNSRSNPWIEPFEAHMAVQWKFDASMSAYYPVDSAGNPADENNYHMSQNGEPRELYATVSLLPNLSGTGKVLIISGTGGAAVGSVLDFLCDGHSLSQLRSRMPQTKSAEFPYFEALFRVKSRSTLPRDTGIVICRVPKS